MKYAALLLLAAATGWVQAQVPATPAPAAKPAAPRPAQVSRAEAKPTWAELTAAQQQALRPLNGSWSTLSEAHKRKWLAVSANFPTMPAGEQARIHSRMAEWAALTPQQRVQARQNYFETQALPTDDKRQKWEEYQALPPEEKRKLAARAAAAKKAAPPPTAVAPQPAEPKLARVPQPRDKNDPRAPRIAVVPPQPIQPDSFAPTPGQPTQP